MSLNTLTCLIQLDGVHEGLMHEHAVLGDFPGTEIKKRTNRNIFQMPNKQNQCISEIKTVERMWRLLS